MSDYYILLVSKSLMFSPYMTREQAREHIRTHPEFEYKDAA